MKVLTGFLEGMVEPFTIYLPKFAIGIYDFFINLFVINGKLNALGYIAAGLIGIGAVAGLTATVLGILKLKKIKREKRYQEVTNSLNSRYALDGNGNKVYYGDDPEKYLRLTYGHIR